MRPGGSGGLRHVELLTRVEVPGASNVYYVEALVDASRPDVFAFRRRMVKDNAKSFNVPDVLATATGPTPSAPSANAPRESSGGAKFSAGSIAGAVIGSVLGTLVLVAVVFIAIKMSAAGSASGSAAAASGAKYATNGNSGANINNAATSV